MKNQSTPRTAEANDIDNSIIALKNNLSKTLSGDALYIAVARTFANASLLTYKNTRQKNT